MAYLTFNNVVFPTPGAVNNWILTKPAPGGLSNGTSKNDSIPDVIGGARLAGGLGDDVYLVADSSTKITENVNSGIDSVTAYTDFRLFPNVEILNLHADQVTGIANDTGSMLSAFGDRDVLVSGKGADILIDRTTGKQTLLQFDASSGKDAVYGFTATGANHDLIRLNVPQFDSFADVKAVMTQVGADVRINLTSSDAIVLRSVNLADLDASDFLLPFSATNLKLTFSDEFNGLSLAKNGGTWSTTFNTAPSDGFGSYKSRTVAGNGDLQIYTDATYAGNPARSTSSLGLDPFDINNGILSITASKLSSADSAKLWNFQYSSGLLTTDKSFAQTYGYFEMKAELPHVKGMFPAFWMMPSAGWPPELDIMENIGTNFVSVGAVADVNVDEAFRTYFPDGLTGMHTYGMLWTKQTISWYVDDEAVGAIPTPASMHEPMYIIVNMAVGGPWAGAPAANFDSATMKVDYVRAYSLTQPTGAVTSAVSTTLDADDISLTLTGTAAINGTGNALANTITGNGAANRLDGGGGNDTLIGGAGNDTLIGGTGADSMSGGLGSDRYVVDNVGDKVIELSGGGTDLVSTSINLTLGTNVENATLLSGATIVKGNALANVITANNAGNQLYGLAGNDKLVGGTANDRLMGGTGNDNIMGGAGNDTLQGEAGIESLIGGNGNDWLDGGPDNDFLTGGAGVDTFYFGSSFGDDHITDFGASGARDVINLSTWLANGINPVLSQTGVDAQISLSGGYSIILDGVDTSELIRTSTGYVYDGV